MFSSKTHALVALGLMLALVQTAASNVCENACSGGCSTQCPAGPAGCRGGSSTTKTYNGVGYTCCSDLSMCNSSPSTPATSPSTTSPSTPATSPSTPTSGQSVESVTMTSSLQSNRVAGFCSATSANTVTMTYKVTTGTECGGPDADGEYHTLSVDSSGMTKFDIFSDANCKSKTAEIYGCKCDMCCSYDYTIASTQVVHKMDSMTKCAYASATSATTTPPSTTSETASTPPPPPADVMTISANQYYSTTFKLTGCVGFHLKSTEPVHAFVAKKSDFDAFKANNFVGTYSYIEGTLCQQGTVMCKMTGVSLDTAETYVFAIFNRNMGTFTSSGKDAIISRSFGINGQCTGLPEPSEVASLASTKSSASAVSKVMVAVVSIIIAALGTF